MFYNPLEFLFKYRMWWTISEATIYLSNPHRHHLFSFFSVFTQPCLEKDPNFQVPPQEIFRVPKPGTVDWEQSTEDHQSIFEATMDRLRQRTNQRRVLTKPVFQDFDL